MSEDMVGKAFEHIVQEFYQDNILKSLSLEFEMVQKAHDAIHKFLYLQPQCLPPDVSFHEKSAFLTFAWDVFEVTHRSHLDALTGHYNPAYSLLRNVYELVVRGALSQSLSDDRLRARLTWLGRRSRESVCLVSVSNTGRVQFLSPLKSNKITLAEWIDRLKDLEPSIEHAMKKTSVAVYDKLDPIFADREFARKYIFMPSFRAMVRQLVDLEIIDIPNFIEINDRIYDILSQNVHVFPDKTDSGRRVLQEEPFMDVKVIQEELKDYMALQLEVVDIAVVIELNIMKDWILDTSIVKERLGPEIEELNALGLCHASRTLRNLLRIS